MLIKYIPTTHDNFQRAWDILVGRYENKWLLVRSYLTRLRSLHPMKEESLAELNEWCARARSTHETLDRIGRSVLKNKDLFVFLLEELLSLTTRREWESSQTSSREPPSFSSLLTFVEGRLQTMQSWQINHPS